MSVLKLNEEPDPKIAEYQRVLDQVKEWEEKRRKEEEKKDLAPIGDMSFAQLKGNIRMVIREEANTGSLPFLNLNQRKALKKWIWISIGLVAAVYIYGQYNWVTGPYWINIEQERLHLFRTIEGQSKRFEIEPVEKGWRVCYDDGCSRLIVPLEANYNNRSSFQFLVNGQVFWVWNDLSRAPKEIRFLDGAWSFEDENSDEGWTSFEVWEFQIIDTRLDSEGN